MAEAQFTPEAAKSLASTIGQEGKTARTTGDPVLDQAYKALDAGFVDTSLGIVEGNIVPYSEGDTNKVLVQNLSSERNLTTQEKIEPTKKEEKDRLNDAKKMANTVRKFLETGKANDDLKTAVADYLENSSPVFKDAMKSLSANDKKIFAENLMNHPGFKNALRERFIEKLNPKYRLSQEEAVKRLEDEIALLNSQLTEIIDPKKLKDAEAQVRKIETDNNLNPKFNEYNAKRKRYETLLKKQGDFEEFKDQYGSSAEAKIKLRDKYRADLDNLEKKPQLETDELTLKSELAEKIADIESSELYVKYNLANSGLKEISQLETDLPLIASVIKPELEKQNTAQAELEALKEAQKKEMPADKRAELEVKIRTKKRDLADAKILLDAEMIQFVRDVTHMGQDTAHKFISESFPKLKEAWQKDANAALEKANKEEASKLERIPDKIANLWKNKREQATKYFGRGEKLTVFVPDRDKAAKILGEVFQGGSGEVILTKIEAMTDIELKTTLGFTDEEIPLYKNKLKDPEFRRNQGDLLAKTVFADYMIAGGSLDKQTTLGLASSEWGLKLVNESMSKAKVALDKYPELKKNLDEMKNKSRDHLEKNWMKYALVIGALLLLLMIVFGAKSAGGF